MQVATGELDADLLNTVSIVRVLAKNNLQPCRLSNVGLDPNDQLVQDGVGAAGL